MRMLTIITIIFSYSCFSASELSVDLRSLSSKMTGTNKATDDEGVIESESRFSPELHFKWLLASRVHLLFSFAQEQYDFDFKDLPFTGENEFSLNEFGIGVRFILSPKVALSLSSIYKDDLGMKLSTPASGEVFSEEINFLRVDYNQVLLQFRAFNIGLSGFYDMESSGDEIESRSGYGARLYSVIGRGSNRLRIYGGARVLSRETDTIEVDQKDSYLGLEYIYRFK
jgi:hypothetical protein